MMNVTIPCHFWIYIYIYIYITHNDDGTLSTSIYRKPTFSGLYLKWNSYVPKQFKTGLVNCLLNQAWNYVLILIFSTKKSNSSNQPWLLMDVPTIFLTVAQIDS